MFLIQIELKFTSVEKVTINGNRMSHLKKLMNLPEVIQKSLIHSSQVVDQASFSICVNNTPFFLTAEGIYISGYVRCAVQALFIEF